MSIHCQFIEAGQFMRATLAALALLALPAGAASAKNSALLSLSMEHFRDTAVVTENPQNAVVTISTENGFQEGHGPMRTVWDDEFLEAAIDENTGQKSFLVHVWVTYIGNLRSYRSASYQAAEGMRSVPVTPGRQEKSLCAVGDCTYTERLTFPVEEKLLRSVAVASASGQPTLWSFNLAAKSGPGYRGEFSSAE
ncbi:MAG: hypothetical protein WBF89_17315, partial [Steroidobacteraceae bacterium]